MNGERPQYFRDKPKTADTKQKYIKVTKLRSGGVTTSTRQEMAEIGNALIE